jgi:hypothetical protein
MHYEASTRETLLLDHVFCTILAVQPRVLHGVPEVIPASTKALTDRV